METQRASLSLGRWSLWLLLLGLALPSASAQALSYREAVLRAVDQLNERSSEANLYRLLEPSPPSLGHTVEDPGARKPVSFRVKETVCPRPSLQPPEQCDFKENGVLKEYGVTVTVDHWNDVFTRARGRQQPQELQNCVPTLGSLPSPSPAPALLLQHPVGRPALSPLSTLQPVLSGIASQTNDFY
ncbi:cathelicidin-4-like [Bos indicus]|uniref:Cathelicidin-4-like n=1 Tax=Bos indicus TaxID=9915 RepID=A0ABM4RC98_BOSIN|nr:TPA: cathelicidin 7-like [Bos taurus]